MQPITITYNDEFDRESYPVEEWHRRTVAAIAEHFKIPSSVEWLHHATIHGRVFWPKSWPEAGDPRVVRIYAEDVQFLAALPGFRWIEHGNQIKFGVEHNEPR